jgi:hypothetical protein
MIPNPNAPKSERPVLPRLAREQLATAVDAMVRGWPATDDTGVPITDIAEQELISRLRREPPLGVPVEAIDVAVVRELLATVDHDDRAS